MIRFVRTALLAGMPFGLLSGLAALLVVPSRSAVRVGLLGGALFGTGMALAFTVFLAVQRRRFQAARPDLGGEAILREGPANHFPGGEGVGGWLTLTPRRLHFRSHGMNLQPHVLDVDLAQVRGAAAAKTLGFIPNGLLVSMASGERERFVVDGNDEWSQAIASAKQRVA